MSKSGADKKSLRLLVSEAAWQRYGEKIREVLPSCQPVLMAAAANGATLDADIAWVSRDVTGLSTKHEVQPDTQRFYDAMLSAPSLRWAHAHSAGADRPVFVQLRQRGVTVTTSSGANAAVVAQTALTGLLALARHFPQMMLAQQNKRWASLIETGLPRDLSGQTVMIVGWGPIGKLLGGVLRLLGLHVVAVRQQPSEPCDGVEMTTFADMSDVLPRTDWLVLACPLTQTTQGLINEQALSLLPHGARIVNVARGEVVDEVALIRALESGRLAGAYLDVFAHEPLHGDSPLWSLPNVIVTPHSAGFSDGNADRVFEIFLNNLGRWEKGEALVNQAS